jgi:hypothetical protein
MRRIVVRGPGELKLNYRPMNKPRTKEGELLLIGFIASCQSRSSKTKRGTFRHPASVLAPESALGSLPSVALSSAQADRILIENQNLCCIVKTEGVENLVPTVCPVAGFEVATEANSKR